MVMDELFNREIKLKKYNHKHKILCGFIKNTTKVVLAFTSIFIQK